MSQMAVFFLLFSFSQSSAWNFNIFSNWRLNSQKAKIICKKNIYTYVRYFKIAWSLCTGTVHFFPLESVFSSLQDVDWEVDPGWHSYYYSIQLDITALLAFLWLLFSIIFFFWEACWEQYKRNRVPIETISMKWNWNFIFLVYLIPKGWVADFGLLLPGRKVESTFSALLCCYKHFCFLKLFGEGFLVYWKFDDFYHNYANLIDTFNLNFLIYTCNHLFKYWDDTV